MTETISLDRLVKLLLHNGSVSVSNDDPRLKTQSVFYLFNDVRIQLEDVLGDEDFAIGLAHEKASIRLSLKVGREANKVTNFSPPETCLR